MLLIQQKKLTSSSCASPIAIIGSIYSLLDVSWSRALLFPGLLQAEHLCWLCKPIHNHLRVPGKANRHQCQNRHWLQQKQATTSFQNTFGARDTKKEISHHWFWFLKTKFRFPQARFWGLRELWGLGLEVWVRRKSLCAFHWLSWCKFPVSLAELYLKPRATGGNSLYRSKSYYIFAKFSGVFSLLKFKCFRTKSENSQNIHKVLFSFHRCQNFSHPCWSKKTHKQGNWNSFKFVPLRKNIGFIKPSN